MPNPVYLISLKNFLSNDIISRKCSLARSEIGTNYTGLIPAGIKAFCNKVDAYKLLLPEKPDKSALVESNKSLTPSRFNVDTNSIDVLILNLGIVIW